MSQKNAEPEEFPCCEVGGCGRDLDFEECWKCGGQGHGEDLHELDPLYYDLGTYERCEECLGRGSFSRCEVHGYILEEVRT